MLFKHIIGTLMFSGMLAASVFAADSDIRLNTVGYLSNFPKKASIAAECASFAVRNAANGAIALSKRVDSAAIRNTDTDETIYIADFSDLTTPGTYYLYVPNVGISPNFTIADDVFVEPYRAMMLGMYLWRCGTAVDATYKNIRYRHAACHTNDGSLQYVGGGTKDGTGGWHDAGDYNKYIVNSGVSVGLMLKAWEDFWYVLKDIELYSVPTQNGIPAYLAEVKWNLDWVAKMQFSDGKVSHKLSTLNFGGNVIPEAESATRYFVPWGTSATASFVAMMAQAARIYAPYDSAFAASCLKKAIRSFETLLEYPDMVEADQSAFTTGGYVNNSSDDRYKRVWAAAELWETTGERQYLDYVEERVSSGYVRNVTEWANVSNLAALTYLSSKRAGKIDNKIASNRLTNIADDIYSQVNQHGYGRVSISYYWGANGAVASTAFLLNRAYKATGNDNYRHATQDAISHLLGRNWFGRSFVTGVGHKPPQNPHDRTSVAGGTPWPGRLIGGPHNGKPETCSHEAICWDDNMSDYYTNEVAINWNAAMVYALASVLPGAGILPAPNYPGQTVDPIAVRHAVQPKKALVRGVKITRVVKTRNGKLDVPQGAKVYGLNGKLIAHRKAGSAKTPEINKNGVFIIKIDDTGKR
jgi:endoglucanase